MPCSVQFLFGQNATFLSSLRHFPCGCGDACPVPGRGGLAACWPGPPPVTNGGQNRPELMGWRLSAPRTEGSRAVGCRYVPMEAMYAFPGKQSQFSLTRSRVSVRHGLKAGESEASWLCPPCARCGSLQPRRDAIRYPPVSSLKVK